MNKQTAILIAGNFFPSYPNVQAFNITSDGQAFEETHHALSHAATLKKAEQQTVYTVSRDEWETAKDEAEAEAAKKEALLNQKPEDLGADKKETGSTEPPAPVDDNKQPDSNEPPAPPTPPVDQKKKRPRRVTE